MYPYVSIMCMFIFKHLCSHWYIFQFTSIHYMYAYCLGFKGRRCHKLCKPGFWGKNCNFNCHCHHGSHCDRMIGICTCTAGWVGETCDTPCDNGFYGPGCKFACKCQNGATCNRCVIVLCNICEPPFISYAFFPFHSLFFHHFLPLCHFLFCPSLSSFYLIPIPLVVFPFFVLAFFLSFLNRKYFMLQHGCSSFKLLPFVFSEFSEQ